jgi:hypothetical protein
MRSSVAPNAVKRCTRVTPRTALHASLPYPLCRETPHPRSANTVGTSPLSGEAHCSGTSLTCERLLDEVVQTLSPFALQSYPDNAT